MVSVRTIVVSALVLIASSATLWAQPARQEKFRRVAEAVPNSYLVLLRENAADAVAARTGGAAAVLAADTVDARAEALLGRHRGTMRRTYPGFRMFSVEMTEEAALALSAEPDVEFVEQDGVVSANAVEYTDVWGIDRIDQRFRPIDNMYNASNVFKSVAIYVIDSGVRPTHADFQSGGFSRVILRDFLGGDGRDCHGHGTHVAGTIAGRTYGVVKNAIIESLRVMGCDGSGVVSTTIDAVHWVTFYGQRPAVVNMSLGGAPNSALDYTVRRSISFGAVYVISAGNENDDAVNHSPSRVSEAIIVGATNADDSRAGFSNYGPYLDVFAPGVNIPSAGFLNDTAEQTMSGTSQAAPHVTGVVALFLAGHRQWSPQSVENWLVANATLGIVTNPGVGSPNRFLYSNWVNDAALTYAVPSAMRSGEQYPVTVTATNTGVTTWENVDAFNGFWLGAVQDYWKIQWVPQPFPSRVRPGESVSFNFMVTAPAGHLFAHTYTFQWQMLKDGADWFGEAPSMPVSVSSLITTDAIFVTQAVPLRMFPGRRYDVSVRMKNTGTIPWPTVTLNEEPASLGMWGIQSVPLPPEAALGVGPGEEVTFNFSVTAPNAPGTTVPFQWRVHTVSPPLGFGSFTSGLLIKIDEVTDDAEFISFLVPEKMRPGETYFLSATFRNSGTSNWLNAQGFVDPTLEGTRVWLDDTYDLFGVRHLFGLPRPDVLPGEFVTFTRSVTVPMMPPGIEHVQWNLGSFDSASFPPYEYGRQLGSATREIATHIGDWDDNAAFVSYSVPSPMRPGQTYPVTVTMRNRGPSVWTTTSAYWLGIQEGGEEFNTYNHVLPIPAVAPGENVTFQFTVTAPIAPGTYRLAWQMVKAGGDGQPPITRWFGSHTPQAVVRVAANSVPASLTVLTPNGGTVVELGRPYEITWAHNLGANSFFRIHLSRDGGVTYPEEILGLSLPSSSATSGTFSWFPTGSVTSQARIRVWWTEGPTSDSSDTNFTIAQPGCDVSLGATAASFGPASGVGTVNVTSGAGCPWIAQSDSSFLSVTDATGSGSGTVNFAISANTVGANLPTNSRVSVLSIGTKSFTVTQTGCAFTIGPTSIPYDASGGTGSVGVSAPTGCPWTVVENTAFVSATSEPTGQGTGTVTYSVSQNTAGPNVANAARIGTLAVAGHLFTINQTGCTFAVSPPGATLPAEGGTGAVTIATPAACGWTVVNAPEWLSASTSGGTGPGTWQYSVGANLTGSTRSQMTTIAGSLFEFTQPSNVTPALTQASPSGARRSRANLAVKLTGQWTHFVQSQTVADFGVGIMVIDTTVHSATEATANVTIAGNATLGPRTVTVTTGAEVVTLAAAFLVTPLRLVNGDFDGDGKADVTIYRPSNGGWYVLRSSTGTPTAAIWGNASDVTVPGDFDGDGKTDFAIFRSSNGGWYVLNSSSGSPTASIWGNSTDKPVPGDYDGDGRMDVAIFRPSNGGWYVLNSGTGTPTAAIWGNATDVPVPGDYDGDGKTDMAIYRPSNGGWYILNSSTGGPSAFIWGHASDVTVPGDYDGDGKTDAAIFRPSNGGWYVLQSSTGTPTAAVWGNATDVPVPGDYDGDGKTDFAVFRPSNGGWYILNSSTGSASALIWGSSSDIPILKRP